MTEDLEISSDPSIATIAMVGGEPYIKLPEDLYIPPDALEVILENFSGPLDLLLYLIKRQNLDILNIPIAEVTAQYMKYIELMQDLRWELAAEYLLMAAMLAEIKSRMLLPRSSAGEEDNEEDPRAELVRRLLEYEKFKLAADELDNLPRQERDIYSVTAALPDLKTEIPLAQVTFEELMKSLRDVLIRIDNNARHHIQREPLSIRQRMSEVLAKLQQADFVQFNCLFTFNEGRMGAVVTFIAILELVRQAMIELIQTGPFAPIHVKAINP